MGVTEEAGQVATHTVDAFKSQPALLFLTLVNLAFLLFVYFVGSLVLEAYKAEREQIHERYQQALITVDRCMMVALSQLDHEPLTLGGRNAVTGRPDETQNHLPYGGPR